MLIKATCGRCGSALNTTGLAGLCLRCLAVDGLEENTPSVPDDVNASPEFVAGRTIGDHELIEEIARGGMGVVFRARQKALDRIVALKMIRAGWLAHAADLARFRAEARSVAALQHPNIVAVYEVGEHEGHPFFSMEFVAGRTLDEIVRDLPLHAARAARYVLQIAEAIQHAHERGVLHRDLKPSNVMIDAEDRPRVMDFGLVKRLEGDASLTMTGQVLGSPNFMPPEQAAQGPGAVGPASDVYALGAILYHLLTGRPPFVSDTITTTLRLVVEQEVVSPQVLLPNLPPDLETICLKCLQKESARRYATARELAEDLGRFLRDEPIQARPVGGLEKAWRWCRRKPALAALAVLLVLVAIGSPIALVLINRERLRAESAESDGRSRLYAAYVAEAQATVTSTKPGRRARALEALRKAAAIRVDRELRGLAFAAVSLPDLVLEERLDLGTDIHGFGLDRKFNRYAYGQGRQLIRVHATTNASELQQLPYGSGQSARLLNFSADGRFIAFKRDHDGGEDADLDVWDLSRNQRALLVEHAVNKNALAFHPRTNHLIVGRQDERLTLFDVETARELRHLPLPTSARYVAFAPGGDRVVLSRRDGDGDRIEVRNLADGSVLAGASVETYIYSVAWHPHGRQVAFASDDGQIRIMDAHDGTLRTVGSHNAQAVQVAFALNGEFLVTAGWDDEINVWNLRLGGRELNLGYSSSLLHLDETGSRIAINHRNLIHWARFSRSEECRELETTLPLRARAGHFSPDHRWLVVEGHEGVGLWDLQNPAAAAVTAHTRTRTLGFAPDSRQFLLWQEDELFLWEIQAGAPGEPPRLTKSAVTRPVGAQPFWKMTASGVAALEWRADGAAEIQPLPKWALVLHGQPVADSDDSTGRQLSVRMKPGAPIQVLTNSAPVCDFAFSPDHQVLAVLTETELKLLATSDWSVLRQHTVSGKIVGNLSFSADGKLLLFVENSHTAAILNAATLEPIVPLPAWAHPLALSGDGHWLLLRVAGRRVQLWDFHRLRQHYRDLGMDWENLASAAESALARSGAPNNPQPGSVGR